MRFIADLHVHSRHSRATSAEMTPEGLWRWAQLKGIKVVGTGDFTHPAWLEELEEKLEPASGGLFALKKKYRPGGVPESCRAEVFFMLQAEVSSIYRKGGRTRKVHSILLVPGLKEAREVGRRLAAIGNTASDGRPILGLDAKLLLRMVLEVSGDAMLIPAHAWTPHFSVFGASSGFDSLEECFEELTPHVHAIETGLSSDPPMNRRLSALDGLTLVSNSDAHSPSKLGREASVFDAEVSYPAMARAVRTGEGLAGTVEFFPEEGKYHLDGHRACGVSMHPAEARANGLACPVCGRRLTVGVMHRVEELSDRGEPAPSEFRSVIPLAEVIAGAMGRGPSTKGVQGAYFGLLEALGPEFSVLLEAPEAEISRVAGAEVGEAVMMMRSGDVSIVPGYDGKYGEVRIPGRGRGRPRAAPGRAKV
ncbi:MAG: endonuclease Q family protein [Thermodesulfovibrionales bacterium]